ncbi:MAG: DUF4352 domain-containing protein [Ardenticatenaceae bacterium]
MKRFTFGILVATLMVLSAWLAYPVRAEGCLFFTETGGGQGGYSVCDDGQAGFRSAFETWGLQSVGYPVSQRYERAGFVTQAFQKAIMQWRPDTGTVALVNIFDDLHNDGFDQTLLETRQTPLQLPDGWDGEGLTFAEVVAKRQGLLDARPALREAYFAASDPLTFYGLPTSEVEDMGNHYAIRLQRAVLQEWKENVPWASIGQVTIANGGDIAKELGGLPTAALAPEPSAAAGAPVPQPTAAPAAESSWLARYPNALNDMRVFKSNEGNVGEITLYLDREISDRDDIDRESLFYAVIGQTEDALLMLLNINYTHVRNNHLLIKEYQLVVDGKRYRISVDSGDITPEVDLDVKKELYTVVVGAEEAKLFEAVANSTNATIRHVGAEDYDEREITQSEKEALGRTLAAFEALGGNLDDPLAGIPSAPTAPVQPTATQPPAPTAQPTPTAPPAPEPTAPPTSANLNPPGFANLGDLVEGGGYSLAAIRVEDPTTPSQFYKPKAGTKLIAVEVIVGNVNGKEHLASYIKFTVIDSNGSLYDAKEGGGRDGQLILKRLEMGDRVKGWVSFEIPENSIPVGVKYEFISVPRVTLQTGLFTADGQRTADPNVPLTKSGNIQRSVDGRLGDQIQRDGYFLSVTAVEDPTTPSRFYKPKAGTKLVAVELVVGNVSGEVIKSSIFSTTLIDSNGFLYNSGTGGRDGQLEMLDLTVGSRVKGWVSFEIPANATPDRIRYDFRGSAVIESELK